MNIKSLFVLLLFFCFQSGFSQKGILIDEEKEKAFSPYLYKKHGGPEGLAEFKKTDKYQYLKEMWYYSESFYVKRDHFKKGDKLNEYFIDISRFENLRKENEEAEVVLAGYKDILILLPKNKLIYSPAN